MTDVDRRPPAAERGRRAFDDAPESRGRSLTLRLDLKARWLWAALLLLLSLWIVHGFLLSLAWASVVAIATWPLYRRFAARMPPRLASTATTPLLFTLLVSSLVIVPMVFSFVAIATQAQAWLAKLAVADKTGLPVPPWLDSMPVFGSWLSDRWYGVLGAPGALSSTLQRQSPMVLSSIQTLGQFLVYHLLVVLFVILTLFFLYRGGDRQALQIQRVLVDAIGDGVVPYLRLGIQAVRATVVGMLAVALLAGVLSGIVYAIAGVDHAAVWGAVTGYFAMIPYLGYVAVAGVALSVASGGSHTAALGILVAGWVIHLVADKVVRPILVGDEVDLGFLWVLMASLGGLEVMGLLGVLVGPAVLALTSAIWRGSAR